MQRTISNSTKSTWRDLIAAYEGPKTAHEGNGGDAQALQEMVLKQQEIKSDNGDKPATPQAEPARRTSQLFQHREFEKTLSDGRPANGANYSRGFSAPADAIPHRRLNRNFGNAEH